MKISALYSQIHPANPEGAITHLKERLRPLFRRAKELGVFINLDMENYGLKNLTLCACSRACWTSRSSPIIDDAGIVIQAYLRDSADDIERLLAWAKERSRRITIRLVKGAYWDYETVMARQRGWAIPGVAQEAAVRRQLRTLRAPDARSARVDLLGLRHAQRPQHGARDRHAPTSSGSTATPTKSRCSTGWPSRSKRHWSNSATASANIAPSARCCPGMAYLVRRLLENTSNEGFLKAKFTTQVASKDLLRDPLDLASLDEPPPDLRPEVARRRRPTSCRPRSPPMGRTARTDIPLPPTPPCTSPSPTNRPPISRSNHNRRQMREALAAERAAFGKDFPLVIGTDTPTSGQWIDSVNPSKPTEIIGRVVRGDAGTGAGRRRCRRGRRARLARDTGGRSARPFSTRWRT